MDELVFYYRYKQLTLVGQIYASCDTPTTAPTYTVYRSPMHAYEYHTAGLAPIAIEHGRVYVSRPSWQMRFGSAVGAGG